MNFVQHNISDLLDMQVFCAWPLRDWSTSYIGEIFGEPMFLGGDTEVLLAALELIGLDDQVG